MYNRRVVIIIPYFGKFPVWFDLYLFSCSRQKDVDFLFYTDCDHSIYPQYDNVIYHDMQYDEYCKLASDFLGVNFYPENPYKICDLRPYLAQIHEKDISKYEWWGYADVDVVYGDLSILINQRLLAKYDIITTHADRLAGHFTIIRKSSKYTTIGYQIDDWRRKLESPLGLGVDEHDYTKIVRPGVIGLFKLYRGINRIFKVDLYDFFKIPNWVLSKFSRLFIKEYHTSDKPKDGEIWTYDLDSGILMDPCGKSLPYLHFLFFKKTPFWAPIHYWKDGFWKVNDGVKSGRVLFTNRDVTYEP